MSTRAQEKEPASFFVVVACEKSNIWMAIVQIIRLYPDSLFEGANQFTPSFFFWVLRIEDRDNLSIILV